MFICHRFCIRNKQSIWLIREIDSEFVVSELVVGSGEQDPKHYKFYGNAYQLSGMPEQARTDF